MPELHRLRSWLRRIFLQNAVERFAEISRIGFAENQWRPQLDNVVVGSVGPGKDAFFAQPVHYIGGLRFRWFASRS